MKVLMAEVLAQKPKDVRAFTQTFFADPTLPARIELFRIRRLQPAIGSGPGYSGPE